MSSYFITGSSRGIGLELVEQLVSKPVSEVNIVFAGARSLSNALAQLVQANPGRVHFIEIEITDSVIIQKALKQVETVLGEQHSTLDVLVNNAGIPSFTGRVEEMSDLDETLHVNLTGTHKVTAAFLPLLRKGKAKKIANVSSPLGLLSLVPRYGVIPSPAYKISKAALNMLTAQYANDLVKDDFKVFCVNPGWVKTHDEKADLTVEQSAKALLEVIESADSDSNGKFLNIRVQGIENGFDTYDGRELPW
ncbi:short-chain dehydrogenase-like protein [Flagelloscypha sp. PMI_526]|nr:short-chain dehydrogenase-like protein [Flagelloscypha sp. PMI_526]